MTALGHLFSSLANTLLELGLPRIRAWLRERVGPGAEVSQVSTEGSLIHLDGVRLPIGPRGELLLERATAVITASRGGGAALPEVRLHAFRGVLRFADADGGDELRADVVFAAPAQTDEAAWVSGELTIVRATWSARAAREGAPQHAPMEGNARLVVTSTAWTLDDGILTSEHAEVRFAGRGATGAGDTMAVAASSGAAASAIQAASLVLASARVGPFVDALQAMTGRGLDVPPGVPLDARLTGELGWDAATGGRCALRVDAEGLRADVKGTVGADARDLVVRMEGELAPAVPMRRSGVPARLLPRDEDRLALVIDASGEAARPRVRATLRGAELGFRFGRPRFQPSLVARSIEVDIETDATGDVARVRGAARVGQGTLTIAGDLPIRTPSGRRLTAKVTDLEPAWLTSVLASLAPAVHLGVAGDAPTESKEAPSFALPRDARIACDLVLAIEGGASISGEVVIATSRSSIALRPLAISAPTAGPVAVDGTRLVGSLASSDALTLGLFPFDIQPEPTGAAVLDLALTGPLDDLVLSGALTSPSVRVAITSRPDVPAFLLDDVATALTLDRTSLRYSDTRFTAYGGSFRAEGTIPFTPSPAPAPARLVLHARDASSFFLEALAPLARTRLTLRTERPGPRPPNELWLPRSARISGELHLAADLSTTASLTLATAAPGAAEPAATALQASFALSPALHVDGSTIRGTLAIADALITGAFDSALRPLPEGTAQLEATLKGPVDDCVLSGFATVARLRLASHDGAVVSPTAPTFVATELTTLFRADSAKIAWQRLEARAYGGTITSAGVIGHSGAFIGLQSTVAARHVSVGHLPIDAKGAPLGELAQGRLALDLRLDRAGANGPVTGLGHARLDDGIFPVLERSRAPLGRYGISPPLQHASGPATLVIGLGHLGWSFSQAQGAVPGCEATGEVRVSFDGALDGALVVTLSEELLASSAVLVVPSLLADRLTVPVSIGGTVAQPRVHADLGACLGRFVTDNRVTALFSEAASDMVSLLTGRDPIRPIAPPAPAPPMPGAPIPSGDPRRDDALMRELVASAAEWDEIEKLLDEHRRGGVRHRIG